MFPCSGREILNAAATSTQSRYTLPPPDGERAAVTLYGPGCKGTSKSKSTITRSPCCRFCSGMRSCFVFVVKMSSPVRFLSVILKMLPPTASSYRRCARTVTLSPARTSSTGFPSRSSTSTPATRASPVPWRRLALAPLESSGSSLKSGSSSPSISDSSSSSTP